MRDDKVSEIDVFFKDLMGYIPSKAGASYEKIATAAYSIIKGVRAEHDKHLKGDTQSDYQIDGLIGGSEMLEAKDYTISNDKVGRAELQKQEGALIDLPTIEKGVFASATGYTSEATKYAKGSYDNSKMTSIAPYDIRPSTESDEQGRIKKIDVGMTLCSPCYSKGKISLLYADGEQERLINDLKSRGCKKIESHIELFYDDNGNIIDSMEGVSQRNPPIYNCDDIEVSGVLPIDAYVKLYNILYRIKGIKYEHVPIIKEVEHFVIESKGKTILLIKSDVDGVDKLITDVELRTTINQLVK